MNNWERTAVSARWELDVLSVVALPISRCLCQGKMGGKMTPPTPSRWKNHCVPGPPCVAWHRDSFELLGGGSGLVGKGANARGKQVRKKKQGPAWMEWRRAQTALLPEGRLWRAGYKKPKNIRKGGRSRENTESYERRQRKTELRGKRKLKAEGDRKKLRRWYPRLKKEQKRYRSISSRWGRGQGSDFPAP